MEDIKLKDNEVLIAIYGTLKKGFPAHSYIKDAITFGEAEFITEGWWNTGLLLYDTGSYPALLNPLAIGVSPSYDIKRDVFFEIYKMNIGVLSTLDSYEGAPYLFERKIFNLAPYKNVSVYVAGDLIYYNQNKLTLIESGCYEKKAEVGKNKV